MESSSNVRDAAIIDNNEAWIELQDVYAKRHRNKRKNRRKYTWLVITNFHAFSIIILWY